MKRFVRLVIAALGVSLIGAGPHTGVNVALLASDQPAPTLQAYRLFADPQGLKPNVGLTPYALNTPLFTDYAEKRRYVFLPSGAHAGYRAEGVLDLPVGAVLVKTFAFPADLRAPDKDVRTVETRLLIHRKDGWAALTYVWNASGTEAVLKRAGGQIPVSFIDRQGVRRDITYGVPNVNQCKECHSVNAVLSPIGPKARNLNGDLSYDGVRENQLAHLTRVGLLTGAPAPDKAPRTAVWNDASEPLDARARTYLDANCGHCHSRAGFASNSGLFLNLEETDLSAVGVGKRPVATGRASGGFEFSIAPGDPDHSIIVHRMASTEPGVMMPQLGRSIVHDEGLALVREYIKKMKPQS